MAYDFANFIIGIARDDANVPARVLIPHFS